MKRIAIVLYWFIICLNNLLSQTKINSNSMDSNSIDNQGLKQGLWIFYDSIYIEEITPVMVKVVGNYHNGKRNGFWQTFSDKNMIIEEVIYVNDTLEGKFTSYFESGARKETGLFHDNQKEGKWYIYFEDGNLSVEENYNNGKLNGEYKSYYPNGIIGLITNYSNDLIHGEYLFYSSEGCLKEEVVYQNGVRMGNYTKYYCNGIKSFESTIAEGNVFDGDTFEYYENGKIKMAVTYSHGKKNGDENIYDQTGELIKVNHYLDGMLINK